MVEQIGQMTPQAIADGAPLHQGVSVAVTIRLSENILAAIEFLELSGATVANVGTDYIEAYVPVVLLAALAEREGVLRVETIVSPQPQVTTVHGSPAWNTAGFTGAGVNVGIIDTGFTRFSGLMGTELPSTVVACCYTAVGTFTATLADCETGSVHGTAVAEAVVDIAPDASLYIAKILSAGDLQSTASWMVSQGVQVINHSVGWGWDGPGDGTSPFSNSPVNTVDLAVAGGAIWVNAGGNSAEDNWFGSYSDADRDGLVEFDAGVEFNGVQLATGETLTTQLRWEDIWGNASRDFDLYRFDSSLTTILTGSIDWQFGAPGQDPLEWFSYTAPATETYY